MPITRKVSAHSGGGEMRTDMPCCATHVIGLPWITCAFGQLPPVALIGRTRPAASSTAQSTTRLAPDMR
jgi:hypothetical protein